MDWALDLHTIHSISLSHWLRRARRLMAFFPSLTYSHIYREFNTQVDDLSKKAIGTGTSSITWDEISDGVLMDSGNLSCRWHTLCLSLETNPLLNVTILFICKIVKVPLSC